MRIFVYMLKQDDPAKCTAAKLVRFGLAADTKNIRSNNIVLNPFSSIPISKKDASISDSLCAIDCSWERADEVFKVRRLLRAGIGRRLPAMLASNPVNYSKLHKLSTAEALSGALYILGFKELAFELLNKFKWGHSFFELNANLLEDYSKAEGPDGIQQIEKEYFPIP